MATKQSTLGDVDSATNKVLQQDDKIDELTAYQVKDAYARGQFIQAIIKAKGNGGRYMTTDECGEIEDKLKHGDAPWLSGVAERALGRGHNITRMLVAADTEQEMVETLFQRFTVENKSETELVNGARRELKNALRGSGMPRIAVMRARVEEHYTALTEMGGEL